MHQEVVWVKSSWGTNSNRNHNLSRKLHSASILTCFRPSRATWRCSMGGLKKWAAKGFSPQHQKHQKLRRLSQSACRVLGRLQGFQGFLRMFLGGCEKSVIQEMSQRFCIKVLNFVSVLAVGYFTSVSLCAVMQSCGVICLMCMMPSTSMGTHLPNSAILRLILEAALQQFI